MAPVEALEKRDLGLASYDEYAAQAAVDNGLVASGYEDDEMDEQSRFDPDEMTVRPVERGFESQVFYQDMALARDRGDYEELGAVCEDYLEHLLMAEHELESTNPKFSEVVEFWVAQEADMRGHDEDSADSFVEKAELYKELHDELEAEYKEEVDAGNIAATAEWDVVKKIVDTRIEEYTVRDMLRFAKDRLALAA